MPSPPPPPRRVAAAAAALLVAAIAAGSAAPAAAASPPRPRLPLFARHLLAGRGAGLNVHDAAVLVCRSAAAAAAAEDAAGGLRALLTVEGHLGVAPGHAGASRWHALGDWAALAGASLRCDLVSLDAAGGGRAPLLLASGTVAAQGPGSPAWPAPTAVLPLTTRGGEVVAQVALRCPACFERAGKDHSAGAVMLGGTAMATVRQPPAALLIVCASGAAALCVLVHAIARRARGNGGRWLVAAAAGEAAEPAAAALLTLKRKSSLAEPDDLVDYPSGTLLA